MGLSAWIPIFRAGTWTDASGQTRTWTDEDLDRIIGQFNPGEHEPPAVIGHPETDSPAYGWVAGLKREGGLLLAQFRDFVPEFIEMVRKGLFKKRSIALYPDFTLRHVGFLGGAPPAVRGLPDVAFKAGEFTTVSLETEQPQEDTMDEKMKTFWQTFRELLFGSSGAPIIVNQPTPSRVEGPPDKTAEFAERERLLGERETKLKIEEENAAKKFGETAKQLKSAEIHAFCENLKKEGKLLPAWQTMGVEKFLLELPSEPTYQFAEATGGAKQTPLEFMQQFLRELPKTVHFGEQAQGQGPTTGTAVDKKQWAATEFARNKEVYRQLNVSQEMLEATAPANA